MFHLGLAIGALIYIAVALWVAWEEYGDRDWWLTPIWATLAALVFVGAVVGEIFI